MKVQHVKLGSEIWKVKSVVESTLAPHWSSGLFKLKFPAVDHLEHALERV